MLKGLTMPAREGVWLVYSKSILTTRRQGAVSKDVIEYFETLGYTLEKSSPSLEFMRGGLLRGMMSSSPASQKTLITVDIVDGSQAGEAVVEVKMRVSTFGRRSFGPDHDFHEAELKGLQVALEYGYIDDTLSRLAADRARYFHMLVTALTLGLLIAIVAVIGLVLAWSNFGLYPSGIIAFSNLF